MKPRKSLIRRRPSRYQMKHNRFITMEPLPEQVVVLTIPFKIMYVPSDELDGVPGHIDTANALIKINKDLPYDVQKEALFHELLHAADFATTPEETALAEGDIMRLSSVLFAILRDNLEITRWLLEQLPRTLVEDLKSDTMV